MTRIINIGGADPAKPKNGNNGNYDTVVAVLAGKEIASSDCYFSDFGDDYFLDEIKFWEKMIPVIQNKDIPSDGMLHDDGHVSPSYSAACIYAELYPDGYHFRSVASHREAFNALPDYKGGAL